MSNWNGKVRCIQAGNNCFTLNKIYEIKNGYIVNNLNIIYYLDSINELNKWSFSKFEEIKEIPKLCEILGVEPNERFKLLNDQEYDFYKNIEYYINEKGKLIHQSGVDNSNKIGDIINGYDTILKLPFYQFSEAEITTMSALLLNNYYYIARDKDNDLWGYQDEPLKLEGMYDDGNEMILLNKDFFKQVQFGTILDIKAELSKIN